MRSKITKRSVDALKALPKGDEFLWDTELRGFGVRVKPSGAKSFVLSYYAPGLHNTRRRLTIGAFGPMTVELARKDATARLAAIAQGDDPSANAREERRAVKEDTVDNLLPQYLADGVGRKKDSTLEYYKSLSRLYILPALGALPIVQVSPRDVADLHNGLRDKPVTANRVVRLVRSFYYWLAKRQLFTGANPARLTEWFPEQARERFLTVAEMAKLGEALRVAEAVGLPPAPAHRKKPSKKRQRNAGMFSADVRPANPVAVAAIRFLMFTGWREQEGMTLRWDAVDAETGRVTLADTKTGRSTRQLPAAALQLVLTQPRIAGSSYVFPGRHPSKPLREMQRLWSAVRVAAGLEEVRLHDLRHSVASIAGAEGYSLFLIGKLLGHKDQRSTARYAHLADDARRVAADRIGDVIRGAIAPADVSVRLSVARPLRQA